MGSRLLYVTDDALLSSSAQCPAYITVSVSSDAFVSDACLSSHSLVFTDVFHNHREFISDALILVCCGWYCIVVVSSHNDLI